MNLVILILESIIKRVANNNFFLILIRIKEAFAMAHIDKKNNQESKNTGKKSKKQPSKGKIEKLMS